MLIRVAHIQKCIKDGEYTVDTPNFTKSSEFDSGRFLMGNKRNNSDIGSKGNVLEFEWLNVGQKECVGTVCILAVNVC